MGNVGSVEVPPLREGGVAGGVKAVRGRAMVVCAPFVEMVGDVISGRIGASVFKVHDDDLWDKRLATACRERARSVLFT